MKSVSWCATPASASRPRRDERIFREFEQADERIARSYGGTGLGLSISERIVKRMGGRITLQSELGVGSTFEVSIPLAAAESKANEQPAFAAPDLTDQSIMLVAPQSIEASLIARRLQRWGGQTCMVSDIAVARALLPERTWHAVLLDHALGASEVAALAEAARTHATRRIVLFTPATRHELQSSGTSALHRLSDQTAARRLARHPPDHGAGSRCARSCRRCPDRYTQTMSRRRRSRRRAAFRSWWRKTTRSTRC